jgi:hypothetical protein
MDWDFYLALAATVALFVTSVISKNFTGGKAYLIGAIPLAFTIATTAWVVGRWVSDRLVDDYGELVRIVDPKESGVGLPYLLVTIIGMIATAWAILAAIVIDSVDNKYARGAIYSIAFGLVIWSLAGIVSLAMMTYRHQQRAAELRSLRESIEATAREAESNPEPEE